MRILLSPRFWMSTGIMCLSVMSATGCRSGTGSGPGWFSWMNPKPSSSALANTPPTKPSVAMLPTPGASTGATSATTATGTGTGAAMASYPAGTGQLQSAVTQPAASNHYNTGPYPMAGHGTSAGMSATAGGAHTPSSYAAAGQSASPLATPAASPTSNASGFGGYQSPYANSAATVRTADSRSGYPVSDSSLRSNPYSAPQGVAPAANTSPEQWNRGATFGNSGSAPAAFNEATPSNYGTNQNEQPMGAAGGWVPPANNGSATGNYLERYQTSSNASTPASTPAAPRRDAGPYRPGSTNRNGGSLPATLNTTTTQPAASAPAAPAASPSYPSTNHPASTNPAGSYPASTYPSSNYSSGSYPTSNYPSMESTSRTATGAPSGTNPYPASAPLLR